MTGGVCDEHARERPDFHRLVFIARRFDPGILFVHVEEFVGRFWPRVLRISLSVEWVFGGLIASRVLVPGTSYVFLDFCRINGMNIRQIAIQDDAAGKNKARRVFDRTLRIAAVGHVIPNTGAEVEPLTVKPCHGQHVRDINLTYKRDCRTGHLQQEIDSFRIYGCVRLVGVHGG